MWDNLTNARIQSKSDWIKWDGQEVGEMGGWTCLIKAASGWTSLQHWAVKEAAWGQERTQWSQGESIWFCFYFQMSTKGLGDEVIVQIQQVLPEANSVPGTVSASRGTGTSDGALGRTECQYQAGGTISSLSWVKSEFGRLCEVVSGVPATLLPHFCWGFCHIQIGQLRKLEGFWV